MGILVYCGELHRIYRHASNFKIRRKQYGGCTIQAVQVGTAALRNPATGEFLPSVPVYIEATPTAVGIVSGLAATGIDQAVKQLTKNNKGDQ